MQLALTLEEEEEGGSYSRLTLRGPRVASFYRPEDTFLKQETLGSWTRRDSGRPTPLF